MLYKHLMCNITSVPTTGGRSKKEYLNDKNHSFPGAGHLQNPQEEQIRTLERELRSLTEERDILKKVVAIFSKTPK